jgi:hypothetical protein
LNHNEAWNIVVRIKASWIMSYLYYTILS